MKFNRFQRYTRQRRVILEELRKLTTHPTAVGLYMLVRRRLQKISLGTVYRNLEVLSRLGVIQKLEVSGSEARFDGNPARHEHIRCLTCGRVDDVHVSRSDIDFSTKGDWSGYEVIGYRLEYLGFCKRCKRKQSVQKQPLE